VRRDAIGELGVALLVDEASGHCYASTIINGRNRMGNDTGHGARFPVSQVNDGPWVVVDDARRNG
jgi:hypothetical protein